MPSLFLHKISVVRVYLSIAATAHRSHGLGSASILYVHKSQRIGLGLLTQALGNIPRPLANLSEKLDHRTKGWPPLLQTVTATCDILLEAEKFTLGQTTKVLVPHQVLTLLELKGGH